LRLALALLLFVFFAGCAGQNTREAQAPELKQAPVVYVYPMTPEGYRQATVGVLPFQLPANVGRTYSGGIASLFKDVMMGKRAFRAVQLLETPYVDQADAVKIGRAAGVDAVLAGRIEYLMSGTELGGARVDVSMRLLNVESGSTVWYLEQGVAQPLATPDQGFVSSLKNSFNMPESRQLLNGPSLPNMLTRIAEDMADVMAGARVVAN